jgi:hypothetical protein
MNEPGSLGAIFRCYDDDKTNDIGYLLVADVSQDSDEPDISAYEESGILDLDRFLEGEIRDLMVREGREMIRWISSRLIHEGRLGKALVTTYRAKDKGMERQYIDIRTRIGQRNVIVAGCFNVDRAAELAKPIYWALSDARSLKEHRLNLTPIGLEEAEDFTPSSSNAVATSNSVQVVLKLKDALARLSKQPLPEQLERMASSLLIPLEYDTLSIACPQCGDHVWEQTQQSALRPRNDLEWPYNTPGGDEHQCRCRRCGHLMTITFWFTK